MNKNKHKNKHNKEHDKEHGDITVDQLIDALGYISANGAGDYTVGVLGTLRLANSPPEVVPEHNMIDFNPNWIDK